MNLTYSDTSGYITLNSALDRASLTLDGWEMLGMADRQSAVNKGRAQIDLSGVSHIDSAGLAWLLNFVRDARRDGVAVSFLDVPAKLLQLAALSSVDYIFTSE